MFERVGNRSRCGGPSVCRGPNLSRASRLTIDRISGAPALGGDGGEPAPLEDEELLVSAAEHDPTWGTVAAQVSPERGERQELGPAHGWPALRGASARGLGDVAAPQSRWTFSNVRSVTAGCACSPSSPSASPCNESSRTWGCRPSPRPSPAHAIRATTSGTMRRLRSSPSAFRRSVGTFARLAFRQYTLRRPTENQRAAASVP